MWNVNVFHSHDIVKAKYSAVTVVKFSYVFPRLRHFSSNFLYYGTAVHKARTYCPSLCAFALLFSVYLTQIIFMSLLEWVENIRK